MIRQQLEIINKLGLHARAASKLVATASKFSAEIWLEKAHKRVNAKSIMGVLTLAAAQGSVITVETDGSDEADAFGELQSLIQDRFGEEA